MSTINTNGLDVNYPIPGKNNSSQGFRNNFNNIKQNLNTAGSEISDLQGKVVVKSALANTTLNNDMANTLISNAATLQFRSTTYNLGNALTGSVAINCALGDVQYGNISGNVTIAQFGNWAPTNTQSTIKLQLGRANNDANYTISFPSEAVFDENHGWAILENSSNANGQTTIGFPHDVTQLNLTLTSNDCGNSIFVQPTNRPYKTAQVQYRSPPPTGFPGDAAGTVAVDQNYYYVCTATYDSNTITALNGVSTATGSNIIAMTSDIAAAGVTVNMPVIFDTMTINGAVVSSFGNINEGQVYYVKTIAGSNMTISSTRAAGVAGATLTLSTVTANVGNTNMDATFYDGTDIWKRVSLTAW